MEKFKYLAKDKISQLPKTPGVYAFLARRSFSEGGKKGRNFLYIGKALNLHNRITQHQVLCNLSERLGYLKTKSETEALLLEAKLIKKYQPKYNVDWKDDKNYFYVGVTKEPFPRVFITHQPQEIRSTKHEIRNKLKITNYKSQKTVSDFGFRISDFEYIGPFVNGKKLKRVLKDLRKIHPYRTCKTLPKKPCLWYHLNQCPAPCALWGKHVEAYDVSNIQGKEATGSMVTFINGKPNKNFYRRFKIKGVDKPNDVAMLKEVLSRRLKHEGWPYPDIILIDGGKAHLNAATLIAKPYTLRAKIMALAKKKNELFIEGKKKPVLLKSLPEEFSNLILRARDEAHRFARAYHHKLRDKALLG